MSVHRLPPARAARLVAWGNSFLLGATSLDEAAERAVGTDAWHRVDGLRGGDDVSLAVTLGRLERAGIAGLRLALPVPGDVAALPGPLDFNVEALAAGEAVLCVGSAHGLVPSVVRTSPGGARGLLADHGVRWRLLATSGTLPSTPSLAEADRGLAVAVREATDALQALDVAGAAPGTDRGLAEIRAGLLDASLPPAYPARAVELLTRARRLAALVALAGEEEGTAVSATSQRARREELVALAAAARHAVEASHNAVLEREAPAGRTAAPG